MEELEILLENYWIIKEHNKELYYRIKDKASAFKGFLEDKLGYQLLVHPYLIKLEKLPGVAEDWMGLEGFEDRMEYAFFCLLLVFLEDKAMEEQFVLSQITEFIQGAYPGQEAVDWTLYKHRRHLIKVLRFAVDLHLMKINDGEEQSFANAQDTEVLYESTGLSKYMMGNFSSNALQFNSRKDIENSEWVDMDHDRGRIRRNRVYRRIVMSPAVYNEGVEDQDYIYIKHYRDWIQKDLEDYFDSSLHVHRNGAFMVLNEKKNFKDVFPQNKSIADISLQMNGILVENLREGKLTKTEEDVILLSFSQFEELLSQCKQHYDVGWSKEYREMKLARLTEEVLQYMKGFLLLQIQRHTKEIKIMPLAGKIIGYYPKDFEIESGD